MWFTFFNLAKDYLQLAMNEVDIMKTAFHVGSSGLYKFTQMPFGLSNTGASFCHLMGMCLGDQQYITLLFYLNDICDFSSTINEMLDRIALVLNHLKEFNLKIKSKKTYFFQSSVVFLGHVLSKDGISPNLEKVSKVKDWPVPKEVPRRSILSLGWPHIIIGLFLSLLNGLIHCILSHCNEEVCGCKSSFISS